MRGLNKLDTKLYDNILSVNLLWGLSSHRQSRFELATRSLAKFVCSHRSLRSLASLARSVHRLAHSLLSLPCGTVEILEYVFTLNAFHRKKRVFGHL